MKKFLLNLLTLLIASNAYAIDYFYIDDFLLAEDLKRIVVPLKAHFDNFVSGWQVDLTLPIGMSVTACQKSGEMIIFHLDPEGALIEYNPTILTNTAMTRFIGVSFEMDYDENGQPAGVAKWIPGDYIVYYIEFSFASTFNGGLILNFNNISCGRDTRSWVHCSPGYLNNFTTQVTVDLGYGAVDDIISIKQIANVRYYNIVGQEIKEPEGLTIVVTTYIDGSIKSYKIYK